MPQLNSPTAGGNSFGLTSVIDPEIPTLSAVLDAERLSSDAKLLSLSPWPGEELQRTELRILKWHRRARCAFEIALHIDIPWQLIGKVYAEDRPDVLQVMEAIRRAGFHEHAEFSIPKPLAYVQSLRLLLVQKVEGIQAKRIFLEGDARQRSMAAIRCAQWLARFHALGPMPGRVVGPSVVVERSRNRCKHIAEKCPPLGSKAQRLIEQIAAAAMSLADVPMSLGHGDFLPGHVLLTENQVVAIDWDSFVLSDPSRDVAWFMIGLRRLAEKYLGSIQALDRPAALFLETYLAMGRPGVEGTLPFHKAALCLQRAKRYVFKDGWGWQERAEVMLDEGLQAIKS